MEWTPPSGFCLDPYNDLNTALHGLQPDQTAFGISPDPFVFCAHSGQFSTMAHFPGLGARDRRESDRHYPRDGVAQLGQDIGTNESGPTFGASASQANTFDFENLLVSKTMTQFLIKTDSLRFHQSPTARVVCRKRSTRQCCLKPIGLVQRQTRHLQASGTAHHFRNLKPIPRLRASENNLQTLVSSRTFKKVFLLKRQPRTRGDVASWQGMSLWLFPRPVLKLSIPMPLTWS